MKKNRFILLALLSVFLLSTALFAACGGNDTVKISFVTDGGTALPDVTVAAGEEYVLPTPTRDGYAFDGWYTDGDFSGSPLSTVKAEKDATFYARWSKYYTVTLQLSGGTLSGGQTTLSLQAGGNLYDLVHSYVPVKDNVSGVWFYRNAQLAPSDVMPEENVTLTAKYPVAYTAKVYRQKTDLSGYAETTVQGSGFAGEAYAAPKFDGFDEVVKPQTVTASVLSENASENAFVHYYDRKTYTMSFVTDYPDDVDRTDETIVRTGVYGGAVHAPALTAEGYYLVGWTKNGVLYGANRMESKLYGAEQTSDADEMTVPSENATLSALWIKGYPDMFGGGDFVYVPDEEGTVAYMSRGDVFFKGRYYPATGRFVFDVSEEKDEIVQLQGWITGLDTFYYVDVSRASTSRTLYTIIDGIVENVKILFDKANGITYVDSDANEESKGTYYIDDEENYIALFTSGPFAGESRTMITGTVRDNNVYRPVFMVRNDYDFNLGQIDRYEVINDRLVNVTDYYEDRYDVPVYALTLNGYGVAFVFDGASDVTYYYIFDRVNGIVYLRNYFGNTLAALKLVDDNKGYMYYSPGMDRLFVLEDGATLRLDGMCNAIYVESGRQTRGYFTSVASVFEGWIVQFAGKTFLIKEIEVPSDADDGTFTYKYTIERKPDGYAEFYYKATEGLAYAPMLALNDPEEGKATIYAYSSLQYKKYAEGTYVVDETTGRYLFTVTNRVSGVELTEPIDLSDVTAFEFVTDSGELTAYNMHYWWSKTENDAAVSLAEVYTGENGAKLTLVAGVAYYEKDGEVQRGLYQYSDNVCAVNFTTDVYDDYSYFTLDEEEHTFVLLDHYPYTAYPLKNGTVARNNLGEVVTDGERLQLDGKGGVVYTDAQGGTHTGTVTKSGRTSFDVVVYEEGEADVYTVSFTDGTAGFSFLQLTYTVSSTVVPCYSVYDEVYHGKYLSEDGKLQLDGYGYAAAYVDAEGDFYLGTYTVTTDEVDETRTVIRLIAEDENGNATVKYFTVAGTSFVALSEEYGTYFINRNETFGNYLALDGVDGFLEFTADDEGAVTEVASGTYEKEGGYVVLHYENKTVEGAVGTRYIEGNLLINTFTVVNDYAARIYVNGKDWSVLVADNAGGAVLYGKTGAVTEGRYRLIDDDLLYFEYASGDGACLYAFDRETGDGAVVENEDFGYYTQDLQSLVFTEYGFVLVNNELPDGEYVFYVLDEQDNVIIYRQAEEGEAANKYGYVRDASFGKKTDTDGTNQKHFDGKTYYVNNGWNIRFARTGDETAYPLEGETFKELVFMPSGGGEFAVSAQLVTAGGGQPRSCTVVRASEEGEMKLYIRIDTVSTTGYYDGYYRFDIDIHYLGAQDGESLSTYEITSMRHIREFDSYRYYGVYYQLFLDWLYNGSEEIDTYTNQHGRITFVRIFDQEGNVTDDYATVTFGPLAEIYDEKGNALTEIPRASYEQDATSGLVTLKFNCGGTNYVLRSFIKHHDGYTTSFGMGYIIQALTREETLTDGDFTVVVGRVVASEEADEDIEAKRLGSVYEEEGEYDLKLLYNGESVDVTSVERTSATTFVLTAEIGGESKRYQVTLTKDAADRTEGVEEYAAGEVPPYVSVTVTALD